MIAMELSFWLQLLAGLLLVFAVPIYIAPKLKKRMHVCLAYGIALLLAAGASFVFTLCMLNITNTSGRGWGGLIFLFIIGGQAVVGGLGAICLLVGLSIFIADKASSGGGPE